MRFWYVSNSRIYPVLLGNRIRIGLESWFVRKFLGYKFGQYGVWLSSNANSVCDFPSDLPLTGSNVRQSSEMCNVFGRNRGCLNFAGHVGKDLPKGVVGQVGIDGKIGANQGLIFPSAQHCSDPLCPVCCYSWARKTVKRCMNRFEVFDGVFGELYEKRHVVVGVPDFDYDKSVDFLRRQAVAFAESVGVVGGCVIFHPKRLNKHTRSWYFSPHFHVFGYVFGGFVDGYAVGKIHSESGYVLVNFGKRKSMLGTLLYQLSHCGVRKGKATSVWFGKCNSASMEKDGFKEILVANEREAKSHKKLCPVCGEGLKRVCRVADKKPFDYKRYEDVFVLDCVDNWVVLPDFPFRRKKKYSDEEEDAYSSYASQHDG